MRRISLGLLLSFIFTAFVSGQSPLTMRLQPFLSNLALPTLIRNANDGTKRLFILQQRGIIKVVQPGETATTNFMDITSKVNQSGNEQGLLGIAFHPQFATNHYFFLDYTRLSDGATIIARYTAINNNSQGDPASERILLAIPDPFSNHNGGMLDFGPDGFLYAGLGDGGSANDPGARAQNVNEYWGKMLRIDPDVSGIPTAPLYTNPSTNPYFGATAGLDEIYALGMRNPWRWSFDRGGTHQLWVADVGQNAIEEFETVTLGGNYGWRVFEGTSCTGNDPALCTNPPTTYLPPISQYSHTGGRCSITGGYVYRGKQNNLPDGAYIYADYCTGEIWIWNNNAVVPMLDTTRLITSFGEDEDGELYVVGQGSGTNGTVEKVVRARSSADFDGDFKTDVSIFRPSNGAWYVSRSSNGVTAITSWGLNGDIPVPEDYDGDNVSDIAIYRPSTGSWYIVNSGGTFSFYSWGINGDIPAVGDFDGDAKADVTVYRNGTWYIRNSSTGVATITAFGLGGDTPTVGDYDGDGKADISVFRPSNGVWYSLNSINGALRATQWGISTDTPAPGDFDGDGRTDLNVYRVSGGNGNWYTLRSTNNTLQFSTFGNQNDVPAVGDYDGDGKDDTAVWRTTDGTWYALRSSNGSVLIQGFGIPGDQPAPAYDAP
jgi:glucose/arabinose dehydrogenase